MRSVIFSQCRDRRMGVVRLNLGASTTARAYDYRKFIVRSTYDSVLKHAEISLRNIVSSFTNTISDDITILHVNHTHEKLSIHCKCFVD